MATEVSILTQSFIHDEISWLPYLEQGSTAWSTNLRLLLPNFSAKQSQIKWIPANLSYILCSESTACSALLALLPCILVDSMQLVPWSQSKFWAGVSKNVVWQTSLSIVNNDCHLWASITICTRSRINLTSLTLACHSMHQQWILTVQQDFSQWGCEYEEDNHDGASQKLHLRKGLSCTWELQEMASQSWSLTFM